MFKSFERLFRFVLEFVLFVWGASCAFVFWVTAGIIEGIGAWQIPFAMLGLIIGVVSGAYFYVIFTIPFALSKKFDVIKNKVALYQYKSVDDFQKDVAGFLIEFFRFPGADIVGGVFLFKNSKQLTINCDEDLTDIDINSYKDVTKIRLESGKRAFIVPVELAGEKIGSMLLKMEGFSLLAFPKIIEDFEDLYLDDQLMHVINQTYKTAK